ncbi:MAG: ATP-binding protein [Caldilineales bacterium]
MRSLTLKLTLAFLIVGLIGAVLVAAFVSVQTRREFDQFVSDNYQKDLVAQLANYYEENNGWKGLSGIVMRPNNDDGDSSYMRAPLVLVDAANIVVMGSRNFREGEILGENTLKGALAIKVNGDVVGRVLLDTGNNFGRDTVSPEQDFLNRVNQAIVFSALGAIALALIVGLLLAGAISQPVKEMTLATQRMAGGELGVQVPVRTRDELGKLATSFNHMSADLASSNQLRRQMTADIAHDLRTPLSVILGYTEALADGKLHGQPAIYEAMYGEAQLLNHLVDDLRTLSLADAGELSLNRGWLPPAEIIERTAASHTPLAAQQGIALRSEITAPLPLVQVDRERMAQVMANLVSNALRYTPAGGTITLRAVQSNPDQVQISVSDTGPGIAAQHLPFVFKRFYRADDSRQSNGESGLGLAIARSIVEAHSGQIRVDSEPGHGATFTITLPAVADSAE